MLLVPPISWTAAYTREEHALEIKYLVPLPPSPSHFFSVEPPQQEFLLFLLMRYLIYTMTKQVPATLVEEQPIALIFKVLKGPSVFKEMHKKLIHNVNQV